MDVELLSSISLSGSPVAFETGESFEMRRSETLLGGDFGDHLLECFLVAEKGVDEVKELSARVSFGNVTS